METTKKIKAFEYLALKFFEWFQEIAKEKAVEDNFSKLKLFKLHFFACAVTSSPEDPGLLENFDNFYALPYGHVESTVYANLECMKTMTLEKNSLQQLAAPEGYFDDIPTDVLDNAVTRLKEKNKDLVLYSAIKLVELSHSWHSWISIYNMARQFNKFSMRIPTEMIQNEPKIFY